MQYTKGAWNGKMSFPKVFCATVPTPDQITYVQQAMFNNNAIYLAEIPYPENALLTIVFSTIPTNQTSDEALSKMLVNEQNIATNLKKSNIDYKVSELTTSFGKTIGIIAKNISGGDPATTGPFPLSRSFIANPKQPIATLSVHRLFVRGHDRFEIAAVQVASQPNTSTTETEMTERLTSLVEATVTSLQACTGMLPLRVPTN